MNSKFKLSNEQRAAYEIIEKSRDNIFVTGRAGTGKSVLLRYLRDNTKKRVAVVAPTGVAALNVDGQTIHSFFGMAPTLQNPDSKKLRDKDPASTIETIKQIDALIIDEISMVRSDTMNMIDIKLRRIRGSRMPFGGVQIIAFGDLYQLPPVITSRSADEFIMDRFGSPYFFSADAFRQNPPRMIELSHIFRQSDQTFIEVLNEIRDGSLSDSTLELLNSRTELEPERNSITITSTNWTANNINVVNLNSLPGHAFYHKGLLTGDMSASDIPTSVELRIKPGSRIMMVKNDTPHGPRDGEPASPGGRWVNGSLGTVTNVDEKKHLIKVNIDGFEYLIGKEKWEKHRFIYNRVRRRLTDEITGTFEQYPLKLAYAVTIHKSQGQTYDAVNIDMGHGAFSSGQTYVALSRCRTLDRLYLTKPLRPEDIIFSRTIRDYMLSGGHEVPAPRLLLV